MALSLSPPSAVLVVGEADFSFSRGLIRGLRNGSGEDVYCTSFMSQAEVAYHYPTSNSILEDIRKQGGRIFFKVDATRLERTLRTCAEFSPSVPQNKPLPTVVTSVDPNTGSPPLPAASSSPTSSHPLVPVANSIATISPAASKRFDFIVFAFPHCGQQHVTKNRTLLKNFFASAFKLFANNLIVPIVDSETTALEQPKLMGKVTFDGGERKGELGQVHVILKDCKPYTSWELSEQAQNAGFNYLYKKPFSVIDFPGYVHQRTTQDHVPFDASQDCFRYIYSLDAATVRSRAAQARQGKNGFARRYSTSARFICGALKVFIK